MSEREGVQHACMPARRTDACASVPLLRSSAARADPSAHATGHAPPPPLMSTLARASAWQCPPLHDSMMACWHGPQVVYKDVACGGAPEAVGRWSNGSVVFVPPLSELDFHASLAAYASKR